MVDGGLEVGQLCANDFKNAAANAIAGNGGFGDFFGDDDGETLFAAGVICKSQ